MLDLARELSGEQQAPGGSAEPSGPTPAEFWKKRLTGFDAATPLTVTVPPNSAATGAGTRSQSVSIAEELRRAASAAGVSLPSLLTASWALLLHRYSGEDDITFGVVKSCIETDSQAEAHIVPARITVPSDARTRNWLRMVADQSGEAAPFEFTSLPQIQAAAGLPADTQLFSSILSVGNDFDPSKLIAARADEKQKYPLVASAQMTREVDLTISFAKSVFADEAIQLMLGHWGRLLESISSAPDALLPALRMITPAEEQRVVEDWNDTAEVYARQLCVQQLFEAQVERTPDLKAVDFGERSLTYAQLNHQANKLANHLRHLGVGAESVVGVCMERSVEAVVSVLAVLKAGGAYVPLDPAYPHDRLAFMLADSQARVLLTQKSLADLFPDAPQQIILLDESWFEQSSASAENPEIINGPDNLAYLIYTSGSTGKPKGVAMIHRPLVNLIDWQIKNSTLQAGDRTLQFTSISFDVSFQEIFSTWCSGGRLVLITAELRLSPRELWQFIVRQKIARIFLPFVALQQLADAAAAEETTSSCLREVITAGEQLQVTPRLRELFSRHPNATLHNHYGPSETHVVTAHTLQGDPQQWPALPPIGRPIQNTSIYLLDSCRAPVPVGIPGELYIGGDALARGYFQRPEVTAEKFVSNPFNGDSAARLYRTGDLAKYLPDGNIDFLGRIDHQVKIRGYRVELGEVEAAISKLPGVRECVVMAREREGGLKQLVSYIVPERGITLQALPLRQQLKNALPEYMVPSALVFLEKLPLTPSGKVDRKSLPAPDEAQINTTAAPPGEKPWLPIQLQLVQIWEEMLGVRPIGLRDNFFDLGGHSILAVRMMDKVEQATGKKLPVTELFNDATIAHLSDLILDAPAQAPSPVIELRTDGSRPPIYFLHGDIIGGGFYARDLARLSGPNQPFYVLPPSEMQGPITTVEEMSEIHLRDLRAHRPHGPYVLGGFCIGALVAYEMAVRLREAGEEVPWIALIDPQLASKLLRGHFRATQRLAASRGMSDEQKLAFFAKGHKVLYRLREEWRSPFGQKAEFIARKAKALFRRNGHSNGNGAAVAANDENGAATPPNGAADSLFQDREQQILAAFHWIASAYTPPRYDGKVTMFLTDEQQELTPFLEQRWRKAAEHLEVVRVNGKHLQAITTDLESFSGKLRERLFANVP